MMSRMPPEAGSKNEPPTVAITIVMITADQFACSRVRTNDAMAMPTADVNAVSTATTTSIAPYSDGPNDRNTAQPSVANMNACKNPAHQTRKELARKYPVQPGPRYEQPFEPPVEPFFHDRYCVQRYGEHDHHRQDARKKMLNGAVVSPLFSTSTATNGVSPWLSMADATASSISASETSSPWSDALAATSRFACSSAACFDAAPAPSTQRCSPRLLHCPLTKLQQRRRPASRYFFPVPIVDHRHQQPG